MVAEAVEFAPVVRAFATWLSGRTTAGAIHSRWMTGSPPQVTATRVGGTDTNALIQLDCWHTDDAQAEDLAAEVATEVEKLASQTPVVDVGGAIVHLKGAAVVGIRSFPDDAYSRYICDIVLTAVS